MDPNPENFGQAGGASAVKGCSSASIAGACSLESSIFFRRSGGDGVVGSLLPAAYPSSFATDSPSSISAIMRHVLGAEGSGGTECKALGNQLGSSCGQSTHGGVSCPPNRHSVHISHPSTASLSVAPGHDVGDTAGIIPVKADGCKQPGRGRDDRVETVVATTSSPLSTAASPFLERCGACKEVSGKSTNVGGCVCTPRDDDDDVAFRETATAREGRAASCFRLTGRADTTGRVILRPRVLAEIEGLAMRREGSNELAILNSSPLTRSGPRRFPCGGLGPPSAVGPNRRINSRMVILGSSTDSPQGERDASLVTNQCGYSGRVDAMEGGDCVVDSTKRPRWGALGDSTCGRSDRDSSSESGSDHCDTDDEDDSCPTLPTSLASPRRGGSGGGSDSCDSAGGGPSRAWSSFGEAVPPWGSGCRASKLLVEGSLVRVQALRSQSGFNHATTTTFRGPRDSNMQCQDAETTAHLIGCLSLGAGPITARRRDRGSIGNSASGLETKNTLQQQQQQQRKLPYGVPRSDEGRNASSWRETSTMMDTEIGGVSSEGGCDGIGERGAQNGRSIGYKESTGNEGSRSGSKMMI